MIKYKLGRVLISKKSKKVRFISIQESSGRATNLCESALQECRMALLGAKRAFEFWPNLDSFFEVFQPGVVLRCIFNPYSKNQSLFLDIQVFKVIIILQINIPKGLDYPQLLCYLIIHFIPMQASLFFTLTNNQSQNYLINLNFLANQN